MDAETSKRRLMLLVDKLRNLPRERFNYSLWAGDDWKGAKDLSCGTTACALGWATAVPELADAGLCLRRGLDRVYVSLFDESLLGDCAQSHTAPFRAACHVFGISKREADYLFIPEEEPPDEMYNDAERAPNEEADAAEVADHIERFVELKWPADTTPSQPAK